MNYYYKYKKYKIKYFNLKNKIEQKGGASSSEFIDKVNKYYQSLLEYKGEHRFFKSHDWWISAWKNWRKGGKTKIKYNKCNIEDIKTIDGCVFNTKKVASKDNLLKLYNLFNNQKITNFEIIRKKLDPLFNYNLPSTVKINKYLEEVKNSDDSMNILIVGAGPVGLFTALYINHYYNELMYVLNKKVKILLIDNRVYQEGIKKPYIRSTMFGFDILNLQPLINQIFCWDLYDAGGTRKFDFIHILEILLYITAFGKNIPMYFTKKYETYEQVEELCKNNNFHYIFDCTGGRLKTSFTDNLKWNKFNFKKDNMIVKLDKDNYYRLYIDNKTDYQPIFLIYMYDKNMKQIPHGTRNYVTNLDNEDDVELIGKFLNKCLEINEYNKLVGNFKDKVARNLLYNILNHEKIKNAKYIKISMFNSIARHYAFCAKKINNKLTYFAIGDTLGNSEFGIWFGMKHSILLSRHIIHLLESNHRLNLESIYDKR
jgi:hypothetical protein